MSYGMEWDKGDINEEKYEKKQVVTMKNQLTSSKLISPQLFKDVL